MQHFLTKSLAILGLAHSMAALRQCGIPGRCSQTRNSVGHNVLVSEAECARECREDVQGCNWFTFYQGEEQSSECLFYSECPLIEVIEGYHTGESGCDLTCHRQGACRGTPVDLFPALGLNHCLRECQANDGCDWYNYDMDSGLCSLLSKCEEVKSCKSCRFGQRDCDLLEELPESEETTTTTITTTTEEPTTSTTGSQNPSSGFEGFTRTMVFIEKETNMDQDVFIRGGVSSSLRPGCSHDAETSECSIDILVNPLPPQFAKYNTWMVGDTVLDWEGPQPSQANYDHYVAQGTPTAWTSNNPFDPFYHPLNVYGDHYWFLDMEMDCSQTEDGWFEFETIFTWGGEGGEVPVYEAGCGGTVGGYPAFGSRYHVARCGYLNTFHYGDNFCQVDHIPEGY